MRLHEAQQQAHYRAERGCRAVRVREAARPALFRAVVRAAQPGQTPAVLDRAPACPRFPGPCGTESAVGGGGSLEAQPVPAAPALCFCLEGRCHAADLARRLIVHDIAFANLASGSGLPPAGPFWSFNAQVNWQGGIGRSVKLAPESSRFASFQSLHALLIGSFSCMKSTLPHTWVQGPANQEHAFTRHRGRSLWGRRGISEGAAPASPAVSPMPKAVLRQLFSYSLRCLITQVLLPVEVGRAPRATQRGTPCSVPAHACVPTATHYTQCAGSPTTVPPLVIYLCSY